jgi:hypothetical protein
VAYHVCRAAAIDTEWCACFRPFIRLFFIIGNVKKCFVFPVLPTIIFNARKTGKKKQ